MGKVWELARPLPAGAAALPRRPTAPPFPPARRRRPPPPSLPPAQPPRIRKPTKAQMEEKWKSTNPRDLAYEIATFMGGEWPTRPIRKVQLSMEGAPKECEDLMVATELNPTLLSEMSVPTRELFIEVYYDDTQDVYSEVMETLNSKSK